MRVNERHQRISVAKSQLEIKINDYGDERDLDNIGLMRALAMEIHEILLDMPPRVERAQRYSALSDMIVEHQKEHGMTDIEVLQALFSYGQTNLKYQLRYERHGNYDTPAGVDK